MKIKILHEDQDLLVINKDAGVVVNRAETTPEPTIQDWLAERQQADDMVKDWQELVPADFDDSYGSPEEIFQERAGLVHRLDKDTSGVLILAKNPGALAFLLKEFKERRTQKKYVCLTHGNFRVPEGTISAPIERAKVDRQRMAVGSLGRPAETQYQVQAFYTGFRDGVETELFDKKQQRQLSIYQGFSLVHCWPKTGRTHQIRVHMKHWEHPLVSDGKYTGKKRAKLDKVWCPRHFLHAEELNLTHPRSKDEVTFTAPLTLDLQKVLDLLKIHS